MKGSRTSHARTPRGKPRDLSIPYVPTVVVEKQPASYFYVEHSDNERFIVNANCICKLIYEYIRLKAGLPDQMEFDLCDADGNLLNFYESEEGALGRDFFEHKRTYYIVLLERTSSGFLYNPRLQLNANHPDFQRLMKSLIKTFERHSQGNVDDKKKQRRKIEKTKFYHKHHAMIF